MVYRLFQKNLFCFDYVTWFVKGESESYTYSSIGNTYQNRCSNVIQGLTLYASDLIDRLSIFALCKLIEYAYCDGNVRQWNFQAGTKIDLIFIEICRNFWLVNT